MIFCLVFKLSNNVKILTCYNLTPPFMLIFWGRDSRRGITDSTKHVYYCQIVPIIKSCFGNISKASSSSVLYMSIIWTCMVTRETCNVSYHRFPRYYHFGYHHKPSLVDIFLFIDSPAFKTSVDLYNTIL